jgi:hypothetical protein
MSSVNELYSGNYYQLPSKTGQEAAASGSSVTSLANLLGSANSSKAGSNNSSASYLLDLSSEAKSYLNGLSSLSANKTNTSSSKESFLLGSKQQATINSILAKYKDAPFTQETYEQIQADLEDANLSADQMAAKEQVRTINTTSMLLGLLNGNPAPSPTASKELLQTKADNYMKSIHDQWEKISSTAGAAAAGETSA